MLRARAAIQARLCSMFHQGWGEGHAEGQGCHAGGAVLNVASGMG